MARTRADVENLILGRMFIVKTDKQPDPVPNGGQDGQELEEQNEKEDLLRLCGEMLVFAEPRMEMSVDRRIRWREMRDELVKKIAG